MKNISAVGCCLLALLVVVTPVSARDRDRDYGDYRGYRERPYQHDRHYDRHHHKKHKYSYRGHWRSWDEWDRFARERPELYRYGRYYRDGAHLMFRTCVPDSDSCIFFSIGR